MHFRSTFTLLLFTFLPLDAPAVPLGMTRVPEGSVLLGTDMNGIVAATEQCARERKRRPCGPELFATELSPEKNQLVESFFLDRTEVSVSQYRRCVEAGRCRAAPTERTHPGLNSPKNPVVLVSYFDAVDYCSFVGSRLPTEAEFELAARGPKRNSYPWGAVFHSKLANAGSGWSERTDDADGFDLLAPVQALTEGATPLGFLQLAGNVAEWTSSRHAPHNQTPTSSDRVVKGGSFSESPVFLRTTARRGYPPETQRANLGFRCARSTP